MHQTVYQKRHKHFISLSFVGSLSTCITWHRIAFLRPLLEPTRVVLHHNQISNPYCCPIFFASNSSTLGTKREHAPNITYNCYIPPTYRSHNEEIFTSPVIMFLPDWCMLLCMTQMAIISAKICTNYPTTFL